MPFMPVCAPSKAFILSFSLALRQEMARSPVSVSALCPNRAIEKRTPLLGRVLPVGS